MAEILPEDGTAGTLIGRVQGRDGPSVVAVRADTMGTGLVASLFVEPYLTAMFHGFVLFAALAPDALGVWARRTVSLPMSDELWPRRTPLTIFVNGKDAGYSPLLYYKVKTGKKALATEQVQLKQTVLAVLDAVRDESGREAAVRLVFEPKSRSIEPAELVATLLAHTSLESTAPLNLTVVGSDGRPTQKGLRQVLLEWIGFRLATVQRRSNHRLQKVRDRIHVLEGRQLALLSIDAVIRIIRNADEPKADLIAEFGLTEVQADDILEIRLRQLARLEGIKIESELKSLKSERKGLRGILADTSVREDLVGLKSLPKEEAARRRARTSSRSGRATARRSRGS
mgnify:CR=1 FL=1